MEMLILFRFLTNGKLLNYLSSVFNELMWRQPVDNWLERNSTTFSFQKEDIFEAQFIFSNGSMVVCFLEGTCNRQRC